MKNVSSWFHEKQPHAKQAVFHCFIKLSKFENYANQQGKKTTFWIKNWLFWVLFSLKTLMFCKRVDSIHLYPSMSSVAVEFLSGLCQEQLETLQITPKYKNKNISKRKKINSEVVFGRNFWVQKNKTSLWWSNLLNSATQRCKTFPRFTPLENSDFYPQHVRFFLFFTLESLFLKWTQIRWRVYLQGKQQCWQKDKWINKMILK